MIGQISDWISPAGFFAFIAVIGFLAGLILGWFLWWSGATQHERALADLELAQKDADQAEANNHMLKKQLRQELRNSTLRQQNEQKTPEQLPLSTSDKKETSSNEQQTAPSSDSAVTPIEETHTELRKAEVKMDAENEVTMASENAPTSQRNENGEIDPEWLETLASLGVSNIGQLRSLSPEARYELNANLKSNHLVLDWNKLGDSGVSVSDLLRLANKDAESQNELSQIPKQERPKVPESWVACMFGRKPYGSSNLVELDSETQASIDKMTPALVAELRSHGIMTAQQLLRLSPIARSELNASLCASGLELDWNDIQQWDSHLDDAATRSIPQSKSWVSRMFGRCENDSQASSARSASTEQSSGVTPVIAAELHDLGFKTIAELHRLSAVKRIELNAQLESRGLSLDWTNLGDNEALTATLSAPRHLVRGGQTLRIDPPEPHCRGPRFATAKVGPTRPSKPGETDTSDQHNRRFPESKQSVDGNQDSNEATADFAADRSEISTTKSPNELNPSAERPTFASVIPRIKDDLSLLEGIDEAQAEELYGMGIHSLNQLHQLSDAERKQIRVWFERFGWTFDTERWNATTETKSPDPSLESIQRKAYENYCYRDSHGLCGAENTDWEQAVWELSGKPIFAHGVPHHVDDFSQQYENITDEARDELYRMGLYNRWQVDQLDVESRRVLARWFASPKIGVDLTVAFGWLSSLMAVPPNKPLGPIYQSPPQKIDDLTRIEGINATTERQLNRIGIYRFEQIAALEVEAVDAIDELIQLDNRIHSQAWVDQAKQIRTESSS